MAIGYDRHCAALLRHWPKRKGGSTVSKLSASEVLISPIPMACQEEGCGRETYFAIMIPFTTRSLCPDHLYPRLRKRTLDKLFLDLGNLMYWASLRYVTTLFEGKQRAFQELPADERQSLPLCDTIGSLIEGKPDEHYEQVPLCQLTEILARMNAQAVVAAMGGSEYMQRKSAAMEQKRQGRTESSPQGQGQPAQV